MAETHTAAALLFVKGLRRRSGGNFGVKGCVAVNGSFAVGHCVCVCLVAEMAELIFPHRERRKGFFCPYFGCIYCRV